MNHSAQTKLAFPRCLFAALLAGLMLSGLSRGQASVLVSCPGSSPATGDYQDRGFYVPSYPGITLDSAALQFSSAKVGTYLISLTVRANSYDGAVLGTSTATVSMDGIATNFVNVTFPFPSVAMSKGSVVCFALAVVSGPASSVYYNVGGGCTNVIETTGTTPPLSVFRRYGVYLQLTGAEGTVTPGWSIQAAIDAAVPGETVTVGPGAYNESIHLKSGVNVIGAGFSSTILKGTGTTNVVTADGVTSARLAGFEITNSGTAPQDSGVRIIGGSVLVDNNWIIGNHDGVYIYNGSSSIIRNNIIEGNGPAGLPTKYAILCLDSPALIANNLVVGNGSYAVMLQMPRSSGAQVINNTIVGNTLNGIWVNSGINPLIKNNIVTGNGGGILVYAGSTPALSYNDVWGNSSFNYSSVSPGPGDISSDPLFDATSPSRFAPAAASPCLHAGDPNPMYNNPDGTRNTMGAYGGPSASTPSQFTSLTSGFLFNTIGSIPASSISTAVPQAGLANVNAATSAALQIPAWEDAPFGGLVQLHGLFGSSDTAVQYYQILAAKWSGDTPPGTAGFLPVLDPLSKIKYTIGTNGLVIATLVSVGPNANGLYLRTDRPDSGYWTSPDLKLLLNTLSLQNGRYDFICRAYATNDLSSLVTVSSNSLSRITLWVDNNPVIVNLASVRDQNTNVISECGIIQVASDRQNVQFEFAAYHPSGFLHSYYLASYYGRNRFGGYIALDQYAGSHDATGPFWVGIGPGTQISNSLPAHLSGSLTNWQTCAYQFHVGAWARTTDGVNRIYWAGFDDHYYINLGPVLPGGCLADLNGDGRVDGADLAIFAARFGTNCSPRLR